MPNGFAIELPTGIVSDGNVEIVDLTLIDQSRTFGTFHDLDLVDTPFPDFVDQTLPIGSRIIRPSVLVDTRVQPLVRFSDDIKV